MWSSSTKFHDPVPDYYIIIGALALYWFSTHDIMDGMRARRLKCGSPLGRVIDEGKNCILWLKILIRYGLAFLCRYRSRNGIYDEVRTKLVGCMLATSEHSLLLNGD
jgi:hypothetical protein